MGDVLFAYPKNQKCRYQQIDFTEIRTVNSMLNRTGHARFRRAPVQPELTSPPQPPTLNLLSGSPEPAAADQHLMSVDTTKPGAAAIGVCVKDMDKEWFSLSNSGNTSSTFVSSITGDGSVSDGKGGATAFRLPPVFGKRCRDNNHNHSVKTSGSSVCHCKKKKSRMKRVIRVPAISSKIADIPADEYSWRKYGQKPIKGSPYPRGYYKCSTVRRCPAKKHVERANDDPTVLIVTYTGEHLHAAQENNASGVAPSQPTVVESAT